MFVSFPTFPARRIITDVVQRRRKREGKGHKTKRENNINIPLSLHQWDRCVSLEMCPMVGMHC
jgi:hypothetical protein